MAQHQPPHPERARKLLLKKQEIYQLLGKVEQKGFTIVALSIYFKQQKVKCKIGLAKAKKLHDKREKLKKEAQNLDINRALKS